jgi:pyruvate,water dikinase
VIPNKPDKSMKNAIRKVWASLWNFRAFEERTYRGIPHKNVAMALLVHRSFPAEESNGVALTANMFDPTAARLLHQRAGGDASVVLPDPG